MQQETSLEQRSALDNLFTRFLGDFLSIMYPTQSNLTYEYGAHIIRQHAAIAVGMHSLVTRIVRPETEDAELANDVRTTLLAAFEDIANQTNPVATTTPL